MVKRKNMLSFTTNDLIGSRYQLNGFEPSIIEDKEEAMLLLEKIGDTEIHVNECVSFLDDIEKAKLDLSSDNIVKRIYTFGFGSLCLKDDYEEGKYTTDYEVCYKNFEVRVKEDDKNYYVDFNTGCGIGLYPKENFTLDEAIKHQSGDFLLEE